MKQYFFVATISSESFSVSRLKAVILQTREIPDVYSNMFLERVLQAEGLKSEKECRSAWKRRRKKRFALFLWLVSPTNFNSTHHLARFSFQNEIYGWQPGRSFHVVREACKCGKKFHNSVKLFS